MMIVPFVVIISKNQMLSAMEYTWFLEMMMVPLVVIISKNRMLSAMEYTWFLEMMIVPIEVHFGVLHLVIAQILDLMMQS